MRAHVGICDVSTLGKIDIQGRDAADSWNASIPTPGPLCRRQARYGLMLREDGFVFDDGTTARLGARPLRHDHDDGQCRRR